MLYRVLEKCRAGFGAAGLTAVFAEGISSSRIFAEIAGSSVAAFLSHHTAVYSLAAVAFGLAAYFVDVSKGGK